MEDNESKVKEDSEAEMFDEIDQVAKRAIKRSLHIELRWNRRYVLVISQYKLLEQDISCRSD